VIVTGTFLAYYFNAYGIQHLGAAVTGSYIYLQPVFAVLLATILLAEKVSLEKVIAAFLIFGGVFFVNYNKHNKLAPAVGSSDN
jgi:drug/metabolite transporter (DMT)-like permease